MPEHKKAERLIRIEHILLSHPQGITRAEIARRLHVHRSTISRDIAELSKHLPIWEDGHRVGIDRDHYLSHIRLTVHESMAVHLAARLMTTCTDKHNPHAASALRKLGHALEKFAPQIARHLLLSAEVMDRAAVRADPRFTDVLETLTRAWSDGRKVHLWHRDGEGLIQECTFAPYFIEPYGTGRTTHVIGAVCPAKTLQTIKLERIERIKLLNETYEIPEDFDPTELLKDAWGIQYTNSEPVEVILRFHPRVASRVRETVWHASQKLEEQSDGGLIWRGRVADPTEMLPWIRGWGADCEVLAPVELREQLTREAKALAQQYGWYVNRSPVIAAPIMEEFIEI